MPDYARIEEVSQRFADRLGNLQSEAALEIIRIYLLAYDTLDPAIASLARKIAEAESAGLEPNQDWMRRQAEYRSLKASLETAATEVSRDAAAVATAAQRAATDQGYAFAREVLRSALDGAIPRDIRLDPLKALAGHLQDGSPLVDLFSTFGTSAAEGIEKALVEGALKGSSPREIAPKIRGAADGITRARSELIARTETIRMYRKSASEMYQAHDDLIEVLRWSTAKNGRSCAACLSMDGRYFPIDYVQESHPGCRCRMAPVTIRAEDNPPITGEEYVASLTSQERAQVLGRAGNALYESGHVSLRDFATEVSNDDWGASKQPTTQKRLIDLAMERDSRLSKKSILDAVKGGKALLKAKSPPPLDVNPAQQEVGRVQRPEAA